MNQLLRCNICCCIVWVKKCDTKIKPMPHNFASHNEEKKLHQKQSMHQNNEKKTPSTQRTTCGFSLSVDMRAETYQNWIDNFQRHSAGHYGKWDYIRISVHTYYAKHIRLPCRDLFCHVLHLMQPFVLIVCISFVANVNGAYSFAYAFN